MAHETSARKPSELGPKDARIVEAGLSPGIPVRLPKHLASSPGASFEQGFFSPVTDGKRPAASAPEQPSLSAAPLDSLPDFKLPSVLADPRMGAGFMSGAQFTAVFGFSRHYTRRGDGCVSEATYVLFSVPGEAPERHPALVSSQPELETAAVQSLLPSQVNTFAEVARPGVLAGDLQPPGSPPPTPSSQLSYTLRTSRPCFPVAPSLRMEAERERESGGGAEGDGPRGCFLVQDPRGGPWKGGLSVLPSAIWICAQQGGSDDEKLFGWGWGDDLACKISITVNSRRFIW